MSADDKGPDKLLMFPRDTSFCEDCSKSKQMVHSFDDGFGNTFLFTGSSPKEFMGIENDSFLNSDGESVGTQRRDFLDVIARHVGCIQAFYIPVHKDNEDDEYKLQNSLDYGLRAVFKIDAFSGQQTSNYLELMLSGMDSSGHLRVDVWKNERMERSEALGNYFFKVIYQIYSDPDDSTKAHRIDVIASIKRQQNDDSELEDFSVFFALKRKLWDVDENNSRFFASGDVRHDGLNSSKWGDIKSTLDFLAKHENMNKIQHHVFKEARSGYSGKMFDNLVEYLDTLPSEELWLQKTPEEQDDISRELAKLLTLVKFLDRQPTLNG